jgi:hypothetical protein
MKSEEFEHVLRAAADIVKDEIVVVGSPAVLGQFADAPDSLLKSLEVDVYPRTTRIEQTRLTAPSVTVLAFIKRMAITRMASARRPWSPLPAGKDVSCDSSYRRFAAEIARSLLGVSKFMTLSSRSSPQGGLTISSSLGTRS